MKFSSDQIYATKLQKGDLVGFKWIYDKYHGKVYGYCLQLVNVVEVAEEITEDVFIRLWDKHSIIDPCFPVGPLLFKMTRDFAWNHLKRESKKKVLELKFREKKRPTFSSNVDSSLIFQDYLNIAEIAIQQLPPKRQSIFNLHYKKGLGKREIAQRLGIAESTVRVQLLKASQFLEDYLKSHPDIVMTMVWIISG